MGITGAAVGINNAIQEQLARRVLEQQQAFKNSLELRSADRADREQALSEQLRRDQLTETQKQHDAAEADRQAGVAERLANTIPAGTVMPFNDPGAGRLRTTGYGALIPDKGIEAPAPPSALAADPNASGGDIPGTVANSPFPNGRLVVKSASSNQQKNAEEQDRKNQATQAAIDARVEALNQAAEHLKMQGEVNAANILRARAEAEAAQARAAATSAKTDKPATINLSQGGKSAKAAIEQAAPLTDRVMEMIRQEAPDIEQNPQKYNTVMAKGHSLMQTLKYKAGFNDETDPRQQLVSLLQPIQAGQYTRSSRSRQMLDLALKHMADPSQTLLTQYQRAKELKAIMPEMLEGIIRAEQPVDPTNPLGGSYFDPNKPAPVPSHAPTGGNHVEQWEMGPDGVPRPKR